MVYLKHRFPKLFLKNFNGYHDAEMNLEQLATKQDLNEFELKIENRFEAIKGEINLLKWMIGLLLAGVLSLILKAFFL